MLATAPSLERLLSAGFSERDQQVGPRALRSGVLGGTRPGPRIQAWICQRAVELELPAHRGARGDADTDVDAHLDQDVDGRADMDPARPEKAPGGTWAAPAVERPGLERVPVQPSSPHVIALRAAVDALAAQDPRELPGAVALQRAQDLMRESERLRALSIEAVGDVDTRQLFALADAPSTSAWVTAQEVPGVDAAAVTLARRLRKVARIAEELKAGRMSAATAARLTTCLLKARPHLDRADGLIDGLDGEAVLRGVRDLLAEQGAMTADPDQVSEELARIVAADGSQLDRLEAALIVFAQRCDPVLLPSGLALLLDALLPLEHEKRAERAEQERGLTLHRDTDHGGGTVGGRVDDELFELLTTAIDAAGATDPHNPDDTTAWRDGRAAAGDDTVSPDHWPAEAPRPRSTKQRRHDALKRGLRALLDSGALGSRGKAAPHIVVTVPVEFIAGLPGALPGRTATGGRLTRDQVRDLLCRGQFTRMVLDARNRVVEVSHTQRTATALERLILHVQHGGVCQRRACRNGPGNGHPLVPHHVGLFSDTGTTSLEDTAWLCDVDHDHYLHGQDRNLTLRDGRVIGPRGWVRR